MIGATSDYNCSLPTTASPVAFSGYVDSAPQMPHTSYTRSCTIRSIANTTALGLSEYKIESASGAPTSLAGTFKLHNPGSGDTYKLVRLPVVGDGGWHECSAGSGSQALPWQLVGCRYMLDRQGHRIGFQVQWYCDDRDPSHA